MLKCILYVLIFLILLVFGFIKPIVSHFKSKHNGGDDDVSRYF